MPYTLKKSKTKPDVIEIHEEEFGYEMDRQTLEREIESLKANRAAYVDEQMYLETLAMLEAALRLLLEEQS